MNTKEILNFLEPKKQNLPAIEFRGNFKGCDIVVVPVFENEEKPVKKAFPIPLLTKLSGKKDEKLQLVENNQILKFIGMGPRAKMDSRKMRRFYGSAYLMSLHIKSKAIGLVCPIEWLKEAALGIHMAGLNGGILKSKPKKEPAPKVVIGNKDFEKQMSEAKKALKVGMALAEGKNLMRLLGALPPNLLNTQSYAAVIQELSKKWNVECKRLTEKEKEPYQLLNAVSAGSQHPSELLILTVHPKAGKTSKSVAIIGKGLCYDSGGLQDKQNYMKWMKEDMAGSASLLGTILAMQKGGFDLKETTHFTLGLAENMMGERAMRADDIYTAGDGQTVEIGHTDAEGRLVLADAICYIKKNYKNVHRYVTIATLTGSCAVALGENYTGMICNQEEFAKEMTENGKYSGEYVYASPWDMEFDDMSSTNADISTVSEGERNAGWIKAGMFLYRFIPKAKDEKGQAGFCHLDIAGSIDTKEAGRPWRQKGLNSGVGVGLLTSFLAQ